MQETPVLIPGLGRSPGEVKGYPLQYSGLENSLDCWTQLSNLHFLFIFTLGKFLIALYLWVICKTEKNDI